MYRSDCTSATHIFFIVIFALPSQVGGQSNPGFGQQLQQQDYSFLLGDLTVPVEKGLSWLLISLRTASTWSRLAHSLVLWVCVSHVDKVVGPVGTCDERWSHKYTSAMSATTKYSPPVLIAKNCHLRRVDAIRLVRHKSSYVPARCRSYQCSLACGVTALILVDHIGRLPESRGCRLGG